MNDLDKAIKTCEDNAEFVKYRGTHDDYLYHKQLAEWLKELKAFRCQAELNIIAEGMKEQEPCETSTDEPMTMVYPTIFCDDAISINAVDRFGVLNEIYEWTISGEYEQSHGTDILIKRINNMPSVQPSREAYKDCDNCKKCDESFMKGHNIGLENGYKQGVNDASVSRKGHWIITDDDMYVYCSNCEDSYYLRPIDASWYYCPHCGAKMDMRGNTDDKTMRPLS